MNGTLVPALVVALAYLIGSIPFGLVLARLVTGTDLRRIGSGNIGATNALRSGGVTLGVTTLLLDIAKGVTPILVARLAFGVAPTSPLGAALVLAPVVGHCFPIWLGFKGGKGVATALGAVAAASPAVAAGAALVFALLAVPTRRVSLGSLGAALAVAAAGFALFGLGPLALAFAGIASIVIVRHRTNIRRLIEGREPRITDKARADE